MEVEDFNQVSEEKRNEKYNAYVERITPKNNMWLNMLKAFLLGGLICCLGQALMNLGTTFFALEEKDASMWCSLILILISVVLTSLNIYPTLATWGGAGALVPITGFANGVCSSAIEYKKEGQVYGIGCQIFKIAGPVILYGIISSWIVGFVYWILKMLKVL